MLGEIDRETHDQSSASLACINHRLGDASIYWMLDRIRINSGIHESLLQARSDHQRYAVGRSGDEICIDDEDGFQ